jgi:osmotically-inducible protein OsmY
MKTDNELQKNVMEELKWQPSVKSSDIGVAVTNGIVTLSGTVDNFAEKKAAEKAAQKVAGVRAVVEEIKVNLPSSHKKTDIEIAEAAVNALKWDTLVPDNRIRVKVENAWLTTEGEVDWQFQKNAVKHAVEHIVGIKGISNLVHITPRVDTADLKKDILHAFERNATIDANRIKVDNIGNKVTLSGTVSSYAEKREAEHTAWNAPGVANVVNELEVVIPSYK